MRFKILPIVILFIFILGTARTEVLASQNTMEMGLPQDTFTKRIGGLVLETQDLMRVSDSLAQLISRQQANETSLLPAHAIDIPDTLVNTLDKKQLYKKVMNVITENGADVTLFLGTATGIVSIFLDTNGYATEGKVCQSVSVALIGLGGYLKKIHDRRSKESEDRASKRLLKKNETIKLYRQTAYQHAEELARLKNELATLVADLAKGHQNKYQLEKEKRKDAITARENEIKRLQELLAKEKATLVVTSAPESPLLTRNK